MEQGSRRIGLGSTLQKRKGEKNEVTFGQPWNKEQNDSK